MKLVNVAFGIVCLISAAGVTTATAAEVTINLSGLVESTDPFAVTIQYDSELTDLNAGSPSCCAKYGPMSIEFTVGGQTASISNANLNVDVIPGEDSEGVQWTDDGNPWTGTLFGQNVDTLAINFGRAFTGLLTTELITGIDLGEWEVKNGCFSLAGSGESCFDVLAATSSVVPLPSALVLLVLPLAGLARGWRSKDLKG